MYSLSTPTYTLNPTLVGDLPATVIAGQRAKFSQTLVIDNAGPDAVDGQFTAELFLTAGASLDANSVPIASAVKREHPKRGGEAHARFKVSPSAASVGTGTHHVMVRLIDPTGRITDVGSSKISVTVIVPSGQSFLVIRLDPENAFGDLDLDGNLFNTAGILTVL